MLIEGAPFVYRRNEDHTIEAVCTTCFSTICSVGTLAAVKQAERAHECPGVPAQLEEVINKKATVVH